MAVTGFLADRSPWPYDLRYNYVRICCFREILAFKMEEFARKQANPSPVREATPKPEQPEKNYKPCEKTQQKQQPEPEKPAEIERKESDGFNFTKVRILNIDNITHCG